MAWIELTGSRNQRSRTYQDTENPRKKAYAGTLAALHYESELGSGVYDAELDLTPVRVDVPVFDGWRITQAGWHYALGKDLANHGDQDGWVGFGGWQGDHWFKFRLARVGYLHWPTRGWDDIGGAPNYNRANLSQETHTLTMPNDDEVSVESTAVWDNIWITPGGGSLSIQWRPNGDRLKEEITINRAGREWITANRSPATPLDETYFGFVFQLDWSDVPKVVRDGVLQDVDGDFADDGESIELRNALDRLLGLIPLSDVLVPGDATWRGERQPLRKRFWSEGDKHYLLVGARCDVLNGMAAGDLIFDPTIEPAIGATADDGSSEHSGGRDWWSDNDREGYVGKYGLDLIGVWARFAVTIPVGATIDANTYLSYYVVSLNVTEPTTKIAAEDTDTPANPTDEDDYDTDINNGTTAKVDWDATLTTGQYNNSPSLQSVIQELQNSYDYSAGLNVLMLWYDDGSATNARWVINDYDSTVSQPPKLHIEYTEAGGTEYQQAAAGTLTLAGAIIKMAGLPRAGTLTTAGAIAKMMATPRAGILTPAGAVTKRAGLSFAGTLTTAGAIAAEMVAVIALTLWTRSVSLTLKARDLGLTLWARAAELTLRDRE